MKVLGTWISTSIVVSLLLSVGVASADPIPPCYGTQGVLPVINEQVVQWKRNSREGYLQRARIVGVVTKVYPSRPSHLHFQARIAPGPHGTIEVIYNEAFGNIPTPAIGSRVEACGDYITSRVPRNGYRASPDGAIIHWVHALGKRGGNHLPGYVALDGEAYGLDSSRSFR